MSLLVAPTKAPEKPKAAARLLAALTSARRARRGGASEVNGQVSTALPLRIPALAGKRFVRTAEGKVVEVPDEVSDEELARMKAETEAAQAKLGKGPAPQPVPQVKEAPRKEGKQAKGKAEGKAARAGKGRAGKPGAAPATLSGGRSSKVAMFLLAKAKPVLARGTAMLRKLRLNEQTHDEAAEKRAQADAAVVIPVSDEQSKSNAGQVTMVDNKPRPVADENKGKQKLQQSLAANVPKKIEDVDNFKRDMKAQHMGADVMQVVQGDKNAVVSAFSDMEKTPAPTPSGHTPQALPQIEAAPGTGTMNLGAGAIAPLQKEHTDLSNFTKEGDKKLQEEGITQQQLDMVDSGDLAAANKEKKGMEKAAKEQPVAMQKFVQTSATKIDTDLKQQEKKGRDALRAKRRGALGASAGKQKTAKSALEKKREEVAAHINGIFQTTQDKVKKRLADLETQSMKRFDEGNAKATKAFEDTVKREIDAYKADRYSGFFGWARKAKDWLLGMEDLPGVKAIFDRNRANFVTAVDKLVEVISADNKRVIQECKDQLAAARQEIKDYVDKLGPALKDIGDKTAKDMAGKLAEMDKFVAKKEEDLQQDLKDKQQAAIKAIDEKIEKMKDEMGGALAKLGKLLLWAAKKFFTWALSKFGYSLGEIEGIISKGAAVLKAIFTKPIVFVKNLMSAAITGFKNFGKNFLKHLKDAVFEWMTGSLEGVRLPQTWDFKGIVGLALEMIGISYPNLRRHMVTVLTEPVVAGLEKTFSLVKTLITEGPMAAWQQLQALAGDVQNAFVDAVKDFVKWKIVEEAIKFVAAIFIPGAGIIKAVIGIYDTVVFFIQKAKQIMKMIANFLGAIGQIAAGNIGGAAQAMEDGLARGLSLVVAFLAKLLKLDGITAKVRAAIQKIRGKVDDALLKVAKLIGAKAAPLINAAKAAAGKVVHTATAGAKRLLNWWKKKVPVSGGGERHTLGFDHEGRAAKLVLRSTPENPSVFLKNAGTRKNITAAKQKAPIAAAVGHEDKIFELQNKLKAVDDNSNKAASGKTADSADKWAGELDGKMLALGTHIAATLDDWGIGDAQIKGIRLPRGSFTLEHKRGIAAQHKNKADLRKNKDGELINMSRKAGQEKARRHVVSSHDMASHYESQLNGKLVSQGKLLIEQRAAIAQARIPVAKSTVPGIQEAATSRYSLFFGYLRNLFIGDSRENSAIQQHLDEGNPELAGKLLEDHVRHIKRAWAMDQSMPISRL